MSRARDELPNEERSKHVFIIQIWWEPDAGVNGGEWRGSVEHVETKERRYFRDLKYMLKYVDDKLKQGFDSRGA